MNIKIVAIIRRKIEIVGRRAESLYTIGWFSVSNVPVTISEKGYRMRDWEEIYLRFGL